MGRMGIAIKRIYEEPTASDGYRVLVDRLWPRGMTKERAAKFAEFRMRYIAELDANAAVDNLRHICAEHPDVTLLYAAKDPHINHALVLRDYLN